MLLLLGDFGPVGGFASLRARHYRQALAGLPLRCVDYREATRDHARDATAIVAAANYGPTRAAMAVVGDQPLWIDLAGDPFAEAQSVPGDRDIIADEAAAVFVPALVRGDAFGCSSGPGRFAAMGALGALGRLARLQEDIVHVVPIAAEFGLPSGEPRRGPVRRVAVSGSFNTWFDDEGLLGGLLAAMDRSAIEVEVTGGAVEGHHVAGFERFRAGATGSRHARRFTFHGWLPHDRLPEVLARCDATVCLDRPGAEPELGSRTRVLLAATLGLRVFATPRTELVRELVSEGRAVAVTAETLPDALLHPPDAVDPGELMARHSVDRACAPLRRWAEAPRRAVAGELALVTLTRERDALRAELAALHGSPTFRALDKVNRLVRGG